MTYKVVRIRYVGKEDYRVLNFNFDWDQMSLLVKAYVYAEKFTILTPKSYPFNHIPGHQKN